MWNTFQVTVDKCPCLLLKKILKDGYPQEQKTRAYSEQHQVVSMCPWNPVFTPIYLSSSAVKQTGHWGEFLHRHGHHPSSYRLWIKLANMWWVLKPVSVSGLVASGVSGWEGSFSGPTPKQLTQKLAPWSGELLVPHTQSGAGPGTPHPTSSVSQIKQPCLPKAMWASEPSLLSLHKSKASRM